MGYEYPMNLAMYMFTDVDVEKYAHELQVIVDELDSYVTKLPTLFRDVLHGFFRDHIRMLDYAYEKDIPVKDAYRLRNQAIMRLRVRIRHYLIYDDDHRIVGLILPPETKEEALNTPIERFGFDVRTYNVLHRAGIIVLKDFYMYTIDEIGMFRNLGRKSFHKILDLLEKYDIELPEY